MEKKLTFLKDINNEVDNIENEQVMEIMEKLIHIDTSVPPGNTYREYVSAISKYFKELNFSLEEVIVPEELIRQIPHPLEGPRINLIASKEYSQKKWINFYGHMDVVPAKTGKWRFPPFQATLTKTGKIYGRGTADMKGDMVGLILALQLIEKLSLKPKYNIKVFNCTDEELGFYPGIRYLAEEGYIQGAVFCMDGVITPLIPVGTAGDLNIVVEIIGKSCHSGYNFLGINAIEEAIPVLNELMKLKEIVQNRRSRSIPGDPRDNQGQNLRPMFSLVIMEAGEKENIVPGYCKLIINRRIIPDEKLENVKQEILESINKGKMASKALEIKVSFKYNDPPLKVNPKLPIIKQWKKTMAIVNNIDEDKIQTIGSTGSTDMGFVAEILNTEDIIITGVESPNSKAHGVNEFIRIRDIKTFIKEIIVFLCCDL
jgi:succinyl-diaminopimelate desuccinylase